MKLILRPLLHIVAYAFSLYVLDQLNFLGGIDFVYQASTTLQLVQVYLLLGLVFWFCFSIVKRVLSFFAFPLQLVTFGLIGFVINIAVFYLCQLIIELYMTGIRMEIVSLPGLILVSFILSVMVSLVYWLIKRII